MSKEIDQELAPKSNRRRARGLTALALLSLATAACYDDDDAKVRNRSTDTELTAQVDTPATRISTPETVSVAEQELLVSKISTFTDEVTAFILAQENNPNPDVHFERTSNEYADGVIEYRTTVTRDVLGQSGAGTRYVATMDQQTVDPQTGELKLGIVGISEFPILDPANPPDSYHIDFEIIPLGDNEWRLAGSSSDLGQDPFFFHSTEADSMGGADPALREMFQPISPEWLDGRIAAGRQIIEQIAAE